VSTAQGKYPLIEIAHGNKYENQFSLGVDTLDNEAWSPQIAIFNLVVSP